MTPRLLPTFVLAPLAFLAPLLAQEAPVVRDTPNRPNVARRSEPQRPAERGAMTDSERERLIRAVRELRQQVDALQERVDEMGRSAPGRAGGRGGEGRGQRPGPAGAGMAERLRALRGAMSTRGARMWRGAVPMRGARMMRGGAPMQGRMPMPGFSPMQGQPRMPGRNPMQRGGAPMDPRGERAPRAERPARRGMPQVEVETLIAPDVEMGDEDVRVWIQGPDGLPGPQPMFLRQLMQGEGRPGADLPEPIRVMMQRRGEAGDAGNGPLRERVRQRVLEAVEQKAAGAPQGEDRPARRVNRRRA